MFIIKRNFLIAALAVSAIVFNSCSGNDERTNDSQAKVTASTKKTGSSLFTSYDDLISFTSYHQPGVDIAFDAFDTAINDDPTQFGSDGKLDRLSVINFFLDQSTSYISKTKMPFKDDLKSLDFLKDITDEQKLMLFEQCVAQPLDKTIPNEKVQAYYLKIVNYFNDNYSNQELFHKFLNNLYISSLEDANLDTGELIAVQIMIGVGYDSYNNYYAANFLNTTAKGKGKTKIDGVTVFADLVGAGTAAVWGFAVAGPAGAVIMGINGALIDSGTALGLTNSIGKFYFFI